MTIFPTKYTIEKLEKLKLKLVSLWCDDDVAFYFSCFHIKKN